MMAIMPCIAYNNTLYRRIGLTELVELSYSELQLPENYQA